MATLSKDEIAAMSVEERMALVDDIWESFRGRQEEIEPPEWHRAIVEKRLEEVEKSPNLSISWEEVRAELHKSWLR